MKWEELKAVRFDTTERKFVDTDVECPNCGALLKKRVDVILTSYPPQFEYYCPNCRFRGSNY